MENLFNVNGLPFWDDVAIARREQFVKLFEIFFWRRLREINPAFQMFRVEAPLLMPKDLINPNYTAADVWMQDEGLVLRPETTPGSYVYAAHLLKSNQVKPPFVVWQAGKSFRREQDQVSKNVRLKEFYQMEFQCIYSADTFDDYHAAILEPVREMIDMVVGRPTRIVESDRLPSYSETTMDVEVQTPHKWLEVCSISRRTDFPEKARFSTKKGVVEKDLMVLEVAIGLDRCVYAAGLDK